MAGTPGNDDPRDLPEPPDVEPGTGEEFSAALSATEEAPAGDDGALAFQQRARLAEDRLAEVLAAYRQMKVDTEKHRERLQKNLTRRFEQRHEKLLLKFMEVLDNLDRALEAAQSSWAGQPLLEGMILVRTQLLQVLQDEGLERIPVLGLPFDPHVAEAVGTAPVGELEQQGLVVKELQRGYRINGRITRVGRVVIGEYREGFTQPGHAPAAVETGARPEPASQIAADVAEAASPEPLPEPEPRVGFGEDDGPSLEEIVARVQAEDAVLTEDGGDSEDALDPEVANEDDDRD